MYRVRTALLVSASHAFTARRLGMSLILALALSVQVAHAAAPDLTPIQPPGWSDKLVVSNGPGNTQGSSPIFTTDTVFVNMAFTNQGTAAAPAFSVQLSIDGNIFQNFPQSGLAVGATGTITDVNIGSLSAGGHSLTMVLDPTNVTGDSNTNNNSFTKSFQVPVPAPVIVSSLVATATAGQPFTYTIVATNNPTSFSATGLPNGLSVNAGVISGTPSDVGSASIVISASNAGGTDTQTLVLTVGASAPSITSPLAAHGSLGVSFNYNLTVTGIPVPTITAAPLPAGLTSSTTGITGVPLQAGTTFVTLTATNVAGTDTKTLVIDITAPPIITSPLIVGGTLGDSTFSYVITATNNPNNFSTGALPFGLNPVNPGTGVISGTPSQAGTFTVNLTAKNTLNGTSNPCVFNNTVGTATATLTVAISSKAGAPAITSALGTAAAGIPGVETTPFVYGITATNNPTSFSATGLPAGLAVDPNTGVIFGLPALLPGVFPIQPKNFTVTLTASNSQGSGSATMTLTISPATPLITSDIATQQVLIAGQLFQYQITGTTFTDPGVGPTQFSGNFPVPSGNISVDPNTGLMSGTPQRSIVDNLGNLVTPGDLGSYTVTITAKNNRGQDTLTFNAIVATELPPTSSGGPAVIVFQPPFNLTAIVGCPFSFTLNAPGAQCFRIDSGVPFSSPQHLAIGDGGIISGTPQPADAGTFQCLFGASKTIPNPNPQIPAVCSADLAEATYTITILPGPPAPTPPAIISPINVSTTVGTPGFKYDITTTPDISNPLAPLPIFYSSSPLPPGLSVVPNIISTSGTAIGQIVGVPTAAGITNVAVTVLNSAGSDTKVITIVVAPVVITSTLVATGQIGLPFSYQITSTGDANVFDAQGLPAGLTVDSKSGIISGVPVNIPNQSGPLSFPILLSAANPYNTGKSTLTLTINPAPAGSPVISSPLTAGGVDSVPFNYQITATNNPTGFNAVGLPAGLTLDKVSGNIFGQTSGVGTFNVILVATNAVPNGAGAATLVLTIAAAPPLITSSLNVIATVGQPFQYIFTASGTPAVTFTALNPLPAGITLNASLLSGTFASLGSGTVSIQVQASNAAPTTDTETLTITLLQAPTITSVLTASGQVGVPFSYLITIDGSAPLTVSASPLPPGLVLAGVTITGTPLISVPTFNVTLTASNTVGQDTQTLVLTIAPMPPPVSGITSSLNPTGTQGIPFTFPVVVSPGPGNNFSATGLPAGLSIDPNSGIISGTSTLAGQFTVTVSANSPSGPLSAVLNLTMLNASPLITSLTANATQGSPFSFTLTASGVAPISFTATPLPDGLVLSGNTISGIPTGFGTFQINLTAHNGFPPDDNEILILTIAQIPDDIDGDGFPNELEIALGTDPNNAASTPFNGQRPNSSRVLNIKNMVIKLNFAQSLGKDSMIINGTFSAPNKFSIKQEHVILVAGGIVRNFTLDTHGSSPNGGDTFKGRTRTKPVGNEDVQVVFAVKLSNGTFQPSLNGRGLTNGDFRDASRTVRVFMLFPNPNDLLLYDSSKVLSYTAKHGRSGVAKQSFNSGN